MPASISSFQISAWSTTSTSSFSAFAVLLAPTSLPQISMSVFAETDVIVGYNISFDIDMLHAISQAIYGLARALVWSPYH